MASKWPAGEGQGSVDWEIISAALAPLPTYFFDSLPSTNTWAIEAARRGTIDCPSLVACGWQTQGRGQREHGWFSPRGNLTASWVFHTPSTHNWAASILGQLPLQVAWGVAEAIETAQPITGASPLSVQVKWPNDLVVASGKLGGILVESVAISTGRVWILGVGINVNIPVPHLGAANPTAKLAPVALCQLTHNSWSLENLMIAVTRCLQRRLPWLAPVNSDRHDTAPVNAGPNCELTLERLWQRGGRVEIRTAGSSRFGRLVGIGNDGAAEIQLEAPAEVVRVYDSRWIEYLD